MKKKNLKLISKFKYKEEERKFWDKVDVSQYFDLSKPAKIDLSALKPSVKTITLRVPETLLFSL